MEETNNTTKLEINDTKVGTGAEAKAGQKVTVHYVGTLLDGSKFDSSRDRGTPFTFGLGAGQVIQGWDLGVAGMKVGGIRTLIIPSELAYGDNSPSPAIPASLFPSYSWSFGNGKTSSVAQPTTQFSGNGIYWVKMSYCIRDSSFNIICCDSIIKPVLKLGGHSGGLPCNVKSSFGWMSNGSGGFQFIDSTTPFASRMFTYEWHFGDGTTSKQWNPFKLYTSNGQKMSNFRLNA